MFPLHRSFMLAIVQDQHPLQMIHFMLHDPCCHVLELQLPPLAVSVGESNPDHRRAVQWRKRSAQAQRLFIRCPETFDFLVIGHIVANLAIAAADRLLHDVAVVLRPLGRAIERVLVP
jgi:hypothetical protein